MAHETTPVRGPDSRLRARINGSLGMIRALSGPLEISSNALSTPPAAMTHATADSKARQGTTRSWPPPGYAGARDDGVRSSPGARPPSRINRRRWSISMPSPDDLGSEERRVGKECRL